MPDNPPYRTNLIVIRGECEFFVPDHPDQVLGRQFSNELFVYSSSPAFAPLLDLLKRAGLAPIDNMPDTPLTTTPPTEPTET